jgi:hypothetical protein
MRNVSLAIEIVRLRSSVVLAHHFVAWSIPTPKNRIDASNTARALREGAATARGGLEKVSVASVIGSHLILRKNCQGAL